MEKSWLWCVESSIQLHWCIWRCNCSVYSYSFCSLLVWSVRQGGDPSGQRNYSLEVISWKYTVFTGFLPGSLMKLLSLRTSKSKVVNVHNFRYEQDSVAENAID